MDRGIFFIFYSLSSVLATVVVLILTNSFFDKSTIKNKKMYAGSYLMYYTLTVTPYLFNNIPLLNMVLNLSLLLVISLNFKTNWKSRIYYIVQIYGILMISELVSAFIFGFVKIDLITKAQRYPYSAMMVSIIIAFVFSIVIRNIKRQRTNIQLPVIIWIGTLCIPICSLVMELLVITSGVYDSRIQIISVIIMLIVNIMSFCISDSLILLYSAKLKKDMLEQENRLYLEQYRLMSNSVSEIRAVRHDLKKHINILSGYLHNKKYIEAEKYLSDLGGDVLTNRAVSESGNFMIDSIINYALRNLPTDVELIMDIDVTKELAVSSSAIVTILGNLLDNAIEALSKPINNKRLYFKFLYSKGRIIIHCENSFNGIIQYSNGKYISTKRDFSQHGMGISNVKKALKQYDGDLEIVTTDNMFIADAIMYISQ